MTTQGIEKLLGMLMGVESAKAAKWSPPSPNPGEYIYNENGEIELTKPYYSQDMGGPYTRGPNGTVVQVPPPGPKIFHAGGEPMRGSTPTWALDKRTGKVVRFKIPNPESANFTDDLIPIYPYTPQRGRQVAEDWQRQQAEIARGPIRLLPSRNGRANYEYVNEAANSLSQFGETTALGAKTAGNAILNLLRSAASGLKGRK